MKTFLNWLKEDFHTHYGVKNRWVTVTYQDVEKDPSLAKDLISLIVHSYSKIGGHVSLKTSKDIIEALKSGELSHFRAIDVDEEPDADSLVGYKTNKFGNKAVVAASKSSDVSKKAIIDYKKENLGRSGTYTEVSNAMAAVLLKLDVPVVEDEHLVREVVNKPIEWYGEFPEFEEKHLLESGVKPSTIKTFKEYKGWYGRKLDDGKIHVKIMVGTPRKVV